MYAGNFIQRLQPGLLRMQQRPELPASSIGVQAPSAAPAAQSRSVRRLLSPGPLEMLCCQVWSSPPHPHTPLAGSQLPAEEMHGCGCPLCSLHPRGGNTGDHHRVNLLLASVKQIIITLTMLFNYHYDFRCC